jgi:hypothetical protein
MNASSIGQMSDELDEIIDERGMQYPKRKMLNGANDMPPP